MTFVSLNAVKTSTKYFEEQLVGCSSRCEFTGVAKPSTVCVTHGSNSYVRGLWMNKSTTTVASGLSPQGTKIMGCLRKRAGIPTFW